MTAEGEAGAGRPQSSDRPQHLIEVWRFSLLCADEELSELETLLSAAETARASRFLKPLHKARFIAARGYLRQILEHYVKCDAAALKFEVKPNGKPYLSMPGPVVHFNLSHCDDAAAVAVCRTAEVGIDIERVRPVRNGLARRYFSQVEASGLEALPEAECLESFFRCWTRKEAFLKATGEGIRRGLDSFCVTFSPGDPARVDSIDGDREAANAWTLLDFDPGEGLIGAVAVKAAKDVGLITRDIADAVSKKQN